MHSGAPEEADAKALFKPLRKAWDRFPTFNPKLMRAMQRGHKIMAAQGGGDIGTFQQAQHLCPALRADETVIAGRAPPVAGRCRPVPVRGRPRCFAPLPPALPRFTFA